ncbi:molybdenum cofactor guanylyltransferase [Cellulomonas soli]|uniref:Molybdenum cofactor guanylyltransferase n=1 Tax=Cellulomonas soli TaxID=931535 RepID=A0A512PD02_9CELL|nr:NTP transferase domain-containing protein [Cellulomonas soli]NYI58587.1 molybdopterin-guanine dinucleotide biosynthesis protein A [Cellulomonas soli]GEP69012.1 molybdenum cofactor guanylyltransferase [Cellulomonas soli]
MGTSFDAVVLAGGRARRLGGASKPEVAVGGRALVDHVLDATTGAGRTVLVAPDRLVRPGVVTVLEDPPDGGPAAGLAAGLTALGPDGAPLVLVLACDVPLASRVVPALLEAATKAPDGARLVDEDGRAQHLLAVYTRAALDQAVARHGGPTGVRGLPVRALLDGLRLTDVTDLEGGGLDADTWDDVRRLDAQLGAAAPVAGSDGPGQRPAAPAARGRHHEERPMSEDPRRAPGADLPVWTSALAVALGVDPSLVDVVDVLDVAGEVAHQVARPAAPLSLFVAGIAVGAAGGSPEAVADVLARVRAAAAAWGADGPTA